MNPICPSQRQCLLASVVPLSFLSCTLALSLTHSLFLNFSLHGDCGRAWRMLGIPCVVNFKFGSQCLCRLLLRIFNFKFGIHIWMKRSVERITCARMNFQLMQCIFLSSCDDMLWQFLKLLLGPCGVPNNITFCRIKPWVKIK